jgi:hypothetical protein
VILYYRFVIETAYVKGKGKGKGKGKAIPLQAWTGPEGSRRLSLPGFSRHSALEGGKFLRTGRLYPPGIIDGTYFC